jgi:hypothetical protein
VVLPVSKHHYPRGEETFGPRGRTPRSYGRACRNHPAPVLYRRPPPTEELSCRASYPGDASTVNGTRLEPKPCRHVRGAPNRVAGHHRRLRSGRPGAKIARMPPIPRTRPPRSSIRTRAHRGPARRGVRCSPKSPCSWPCQQGSRLPVPANAGRAAGQRRAARGGTWGGQGGGGCGHPARRLPGTARLTSGIGPPNGHLTVLDGRAPGTYYHGEVSPGARIMRPYRNMSLSGGISRSSPVPPPLGYS